MEGPAYMFGSCLLSWLTHSQGAWDYHLLVNTRATRSLVFNLFGVKYRVWESDANWELSPKKKHTKEAHTQSFAFKFGEFTNSQSPSWTSRLQWPFFCLILLFLILTNKIFWPLQVFSKCLFEFNWSMNELSCCLPSTVSGQWRSTKWCKTFPRHEINQPKTPFRMWESTSFSFHFLFTPNLWINSLYISSSWYL